MNIRVKGLFMEETTKKLESGEYVREVALYQQGNRNLIVVKDVDKNLEFLPGTEYDFECKATVWSTNNAKGLSLKYISVK